MPGRKSNKNKRVWGGDEGDNYEDAVGNVLNKHDEVYLKTKDTHIDMEKYPKFTITELLEGDHHNQVYYRVKLNNNNYYTTDVLVKADKDSVDKYNKLIEDANEKHRIEIEETLKEFERKTVPGMIEKLKLVIPKDFIISEDEYDSIVRQIPGLYQSTDNKYQLITNLDKPYPEVAITGGIFFLIKHQDAVVFHIFRDNTNSVVLVTLPKPGDHEYIKKRYEIIKQLNPTQRIELFKNISENPYLFSYMHNSEFLEIVNKINPDINASLGGKPKRSLRKRRKSKRRKSHRRRK